MARYAPEKMELGLGLVSGPSRRRSRKAGLWRRHRSICPDGFETPGEGENPGAAPPGEKLRCTSKAWIIEEPVPIRPSCHYMMGGIHVVNKTCRTPIEGILAAGECACISIHGANRLGAIRWPMWCSSAARRFGCPGNRQTTLVAPGKKRGGPLIKTFDRMRRKTEGIPVTEIATKWRKPWNNVGFSAGKAK